MLKRGMDLVPLPFGDKGAAVATYFASGERAPVFARPRLYSRPCAYFLATDKGKEFPYRSNSVVTALEGQTSDESLSGARSSFSESYVQHRSNFLSYWTGAQWLMALVTDDKNARSVIRNQ